MRTLGLWRCKWGLWDMMRFGRWWGYEIIRRVQDLACFLSTIWEFNEKTAICNQEEGLYHSSLGVPLIFPASKTIRNKFLLFISHSIYDSFQDEPKLSIYFLNSGITKNFADKLIWLSTEAKIFPLKCRFHQY